MAVLSSNKPRRSLRNRASSAGKGAGANARDAGGALVEAVGRLADKAIDRVLLTDERITSAADGKRLLAGEADVEALAGDIQRVVVLAVPVVRRLARGARLTRVPWVMVASSVVSVGVAVRTVCAGAAGARFVGGLPARAGHRRAQRAGTRQEAGDRSLPRSEAYPSPGRREAAPPSAHSQVDFEWGRGQEDVEASDEVRSMPRSDSTRPRSPRAGTRCVGGRTSQRATVRARPESLSA
jgi:hypothetical protein